MNAAEKKVLVDGREGVPGPGGEKVWIGDFVIVCDGRASYIGIEKPDPPLPEPIRSTTPGVAKAEPLVGEFLAVTEFRTLSPAYVYIEGWPIGPGGQISRVRACAPLEMVPSADTIDVKARSIFRLAHLDAADRELFAGLIRDAEKHRAHVRAQRAGIQIVGAGALPTPSQSGRA
jgi:hypothetical protein